MAKIIVHVDGYGDIRIKRPKQLTADAFSGRIADAVAKTMQLITTQPERFHPTIGFTA